MKYCFFNDRVVCRPLWCRWSRPLKAASSVSLNDIKCGAEPQTGQRHSGPPTDGPSRADAAELHVGLIWPRHPDGPVRAQDRWRRSGSPTHAAPAVLRSFKVPLVELLADRSPFSGWWSSLDVWWVSSMSPQERWWFQRTFLKREDQTNRSGGARIFASNRYF